MKNIGVLSLQGDFERHIQTVEGLGHRATAIRQAAELQHCNGLILPGGESTTIAMLMQRRGMDKAIGTAIQGGLPVFGTCAGMILLAKTITGRSEFSFRVLDIDIERNAYGSQIDSFETELNIRTGGGGGSNESGGGGLIPDFTFTDFTFTAVFIRAPRITACAAGTEVLAEFDGYPVMVRQGNILATSFHPELTPDARIHDLFINALC